MKRVLSLMVGCLLVLAACASPTQGTSSTTAAGPATTAGGGAASPSGELVVYTSEPQAKIDELIKAYNQKVPGVTVKVYRAGTGELKTRIEGEKKSGKIKADLLLAADAPTFEVYRKAGDLQPYKPADVDKLPKEMVQAEYYYVGTRVIPTVLAYNTTKVTNPPKSWKDLTDPAWNGKIAMPNPRVSGAAAFNTAVWLDDPNLGEPWLNALGANKPVILESNGPVGQNVANGTQEVGVVVDYLVRELAAKGSPIKVAYPSDGVPYISQPMGIFKDAPNAAAAKSFADFIISLEGQKLAVKQQYLPVRDDAGAPEGAPRLSELKLMNPDLDKIVATQEDAVKKFEAATKN